MALSGLMEKSRGMIDTETWVLPRPRKNKYKGGFPLHFEKKLIRKLGFDEIADRAKILHPFGGAAEFGIRCDLVASTMPDKVADAHDLPSGNLAVSYRTRPFNLSSGCPLIRKERYWRSL